MTYNFEQMHYTEVRDLFRKWREDNVRRSEDTVDLWENVLAAKVAKLGNERHLVLEQVIIAGLDGGRVDIADDCIRVLSAEFPGSQRVQKYVAMRLEALGLWDDALRVLDSIIAKDETNAAPRKRKVAIWKARGQRQQAIEELCDYLEKFQADQEAWHELCNCYLAEGQLAKAAFCMEEVLLHNPHSHLVHQRLAEIRYTLGGLENVELAKQYYLQAYKLNSKNLRVLYGLFLCYKHLTTASKSTPSKRAEAQQLADRILAEIAAVSAEEKDARSLVALSAAFGALDVKQN